MDKKKIFERLRYIYKRVIWIFRGVRFERIDGKRSIFKPSNIIISPNVDIGYGSVLSCYGGGKIILRGNSRICKNSLLVSCGGILDIGNNVQIGDNCWFTAQGNIYIGDNVLFSNKISIVANEHKYDDVSRPICKQMDISKEIRIGEDSWIGVNVTILAGSIIGKHCVVGANSLVKDKFPNLSVIAGNPAKVIKYYDGNEWRRVMGSAFRN